MEQHPIIFHPIGLIRTAHQSPEETPIQPIFATRAPFRPNPIGLSIFERDGWQDRVDDATAWQRGRRGYKG